LIMMRMARERFVKCMVLLSPPGIARVSLEPAALSRAAPVYRSRFRGGQDESG
jgi:hypothetical protein